MIKPTKQKKARKGKIKISATSHLTQKNDNTRVARRDTTSYPQMTSQMPRSNGMVLKVKVKRK